MRRTTSAPSVASRRERGAARAAAKVARLAAERAPRLSARGRPRRGKAGPALYCLTVRLNPEERTAVQSAAASLALSVADYARRQLMGRLRDVAPVRMVTQPAQVDVEHARVMAGLGNNVNQMTRCWNTALRLIGTGGPFTETDCAQLRGVTERVRGLLNHFGSEEPKGASTGRVRSAAEDIFGKAARR